MKKIFLLLFLIFSLVGCEYEQLIIDETTETPEIETTEIIVIVKVSNNTIDMTKPGEQYAEVTLARVNPDNHDEIYEEYEDVEWSVASTDDQILKVAVDSLTEATANKCRITLIGLKSGEAYITASCILDGVTYTSSNSNENKIIVNEDRNFEFLNCPTSIVPGKIYKCSLKTNFEGEVNLYKTGSLNIDLYPLMNLDTVKTVYVKPGVSTDFWIAYNGENNHEESIIAKTSNNTVVAENKIMCFGEIVFKLHYYEYNYYDDDGLGNDIIPRGWNEIRMDASCGDEVIYGLPFAFTSSPKLFFVENKHSENNFVDYNDLNIKSLYCFAFGKTMFFDNIWPLQYEGTLNNVINPDKTITQRLKNSKTYIEKHSKNNVELIPITIDEIKGTIENNSNVSILTVDSSTYYKNLYIEDDNGNLELYMPFEINYVNNNKVDIYGIEYGQYYDSGWKPYYYGFYAIK